MRASATIQRVRIHDEVEAVGALVDALRGRRALVLTGAGISTDSGIPDYRGPATKHLVRRPILHADFLAHEATRRRYWARSLVGYPRFAAARPNAAHVAVARLESAGHSTGLVTQNVDSLHVRAGHRDIVELHGSLATVRCLACGATEPRETTQARLRDANPAFEGIGEARADGDAELEADGLEGFRVPACVGCDGTLMPDVVFFGGSVPRERTERALGWLDASDALLVVGSSLTVFSGYRFARAARAQNKPVLLLTMGETRADPIATLKLDVAITPVLCGAAEALCPKTIEPTTHP